MQKTIVAPGSLESGGVNVPGPFYGFEGFVLNNANEEWDDIMGIHVKRFNDNFTEVGTWTVNSSSPGALLWHMRDFVAHPSGIYELVFQDDAPPSAFRVNVENMLESSDVLLLGIEFSGNTNASVSFSIDDIHVNYTELSSLEEVMNSGGETFWQNTANNRIWVKLRGGRW